MNSPATEHRHTLNAPPPGLNQEVQSDWVEMGLTTRNPAVYQGDLVADRPEPVRRWLTHAIAPGTPLLTSAELATHGRIRLGAWREFTATQRQTLALGYVWAGTARMFGLPVLGFDRYRRGVGENAWKLFRSITVRSAAGPDAARSAAGRHAADLLLSAPATALDPHVSWQVLDRDRAVARIRVGAVAHEVTIVVNPSGALSSISMPRWGARPDGSFTERIFGADLGGEATFDGFTIPCSVTAGWDHGTDGWTDGQSVRYTVDRARFR